MSGFKLGIKLDGLKNVKTPGAENNDANAFLSIALLVAQSSKH